MALISGGVLSYKGLPVSFPPKPYSASASGLGHRFSTGKPRGTDLSRGSCFKPCQASYFKEAFPFPEALRPVDSSSTEQDSLTVFRDETKGIVCYRTSNGEITCEGIDEGPHFDPPSQYLRVQFQRQLISTKARYDEAYVNGAGI